jgi:hypothetical protein
MSDEYDMLDYVIREHVGYIEPGDEPLDEKNPESADPVLHDNIVDECQKHIDDPEMYPMDKLSKDAQACINEWEELLKDTPLNKQYEWNF